jgi:hypothetical protein
MSKTADQIVKHLFGHARFPDWGGDNEHILAGIELEFLVSRIGNENALMRRVDFLSFVDAMNRRDFNDNHAGGQRYRLSKEFASGYIVIEPDYAFHVLEIAFPPRRTPQEFRAMVCPTIDAIDDALGEIGFQRLEKSILDPPPRGYDLVNLDRLANFSQHLLKAASPDAVKHPLFVPHFGALLASMHVHLNACGSPLDLNLLPNLYELEWLAHVLFSNCKIFKGKRYCNARALIYPATFPPSYELVYVPPHIPENITELAAIYDRSFPALFPMEPIRGIKDMSIIRPRSFGTFEFRSACTMSNIDKMLGVIGFRIAQLTYAKIFRGKKINAVTGWHRMSVEAVANGHQPCDSVLDAMNQSVDRFNMAIAKMPEEWRMHVPKLSRDSVPLLTNAGGLNARSAI